MDSCFPPLGILGQREINKFSAIAIDTKKTQDGERFWKNTVTNFPNSISTPSKLTDRASSGKIETLQDLDLYYVRQLARNSKEYDLERKIELEIKMREGSSRLLAAARHPAQSLEAARALLTSNERMSTYMAELQKRKKDTSTKSSVPESRGRLSISELRFPLMWRDSDHFKNRGDHRRFAVFCLARVGMEIHDTSLICPVDREQTDISFPDLLIFNNVPAEFELVLEIYSHVLQQDFSIASTPRRIKKTIHSSISKTVGKKLAASLRDELDSGITGPQFDLVARARLSLDDTHTNVHTHDLVVNSFDNKSHALPLFGHFCCRLAVQPNCFVEDICAGTVSSNGRYSWARLRGFCMEIWESKKFMEQQQDPICTISVNKETSIRRSKSKDKQLRIINSVDGIESCDIIEFDSKDDAERWLKQLIAHANDHSRWKHAAVVFQHIPCIEDSTQNTIIGTGTSTCVSGSRSTRNSFVDNKRQGSLYDETPLTDSIMNERSTTLGTSVQSSKSSLVHETAISTTRRPPSITVPIITFKSHWAFSEKNDQR